MQFSVILLHGSINDSNQVEHFLCYDDATNTLMAFVKTVNSIDVKNPV